jgi:hypothetical protein
VENIHLEVIEDHIIYKDPERHKAKLLETIQGEQIDKHENKNRQDITIRN